MKNFKQINDEVYYCSESNINLGLNEIRWLIKKAGTNSRKRARICMHSDTEHSLHEMIIVHHRNVYVRPHYHNKKTESFHILAGEADIVIFSSLGQVVDVMSVGDYGSGKTFYCRLPEGCYHSMIVYSETFVVHEITGGPFIRTQTFFPEWAPSEEEEENVGKYQTELTKLVEHFKSDKLKG